MFNPITGIGTWALTIPGPDTLPPNTYDVEANVGYGPDLPGIDNHTIDVTTNELVINTNIPDTTPPTITSIERTTGEFITTSELIIQDFVDFKVTFSEEVTANIDTGDFEITGAGSTGSTISSVIQTGTNTYIVRVSDIPTSNLGILDLNLVAHNDLVDISGNLLGGLPANLVPTTGIDETYNISNNMPPVNILPASPIVTEAIQTPIAGISVTDINTNLTSVVVSVSAGSSINLIASGLANISGNDTNSVTITGTQAEINATLASLRSDVTHELLKEW